MRNPLIDLLTTKGIPFVIREDGRLFQIPAGSDDADPAEDDDPPPPAEDPKPDPVAERFTQMEQRLSEQQTSYTTLNNQYQRLQGAYDAMVAGQQVPTKTPITHPEPTDAEIAAAYEAGNYVEAARLSRQAATAIAKREMQVLNDTEIAPLAGRINNIGMPAVAALTRRVVTSQLNERSRELYDKNKEAIHETLAGLPPDAQLTPEVVERAIAYHAGVALMNGDYDKAVREEAERLVRGGKVPGITVGDRKPSTTGEQNWEELFGAGTAMVAEQLGGWEKVGPKFGYPTTADYARACGLLPTGGVQ